MRGDGMENFDRRHKVTWKRALKHPWTIVLVQHLIDSAPVLSVPIQELILRDISRRLARRFSNKPAPRLIVANHGWLTLALTQAQRKFGMDVPVLTFETSTRNANALWATPHVERIVTATDLNRRKLHRLGVPISRIDVVGYPVKQEFLHPLSKTEARLKLALEDRPTCLISLGGEGLAATPEKIVTAIKEADESLQIVVIAGRNKTLQRALEDLRPRDRAFKVCGFVDNMAEYVAACDVVVGKSGPATTYETLAVGRPLISPQRFGLAENKLLRVLERLEIGGYFPDPSLLVREVFRYTGSQSERDRVFERTRKLDFPGMAERLARYITFYSQNRMPDTSVCGNGLDFFAE
jgi:UDP-N-acetylglucosamine:LPS N-acetylglucosamine transferase